MFGGAGAACQVGVRNRGYQRSFFGSLETPERQPYKRGVFFTTISFLFVIAGVILTWLGFSDVLGSSRVKTTGPLMIAFALLLFLIAIKHFLLARKQTAQDRGIQELVAGGRIAAVIIERPCADSCPTTVVMEPVRRHSGDSTRSHTSEPPTYTEVTETTISDFVSVDSYPNGIHPNPPPTYEESTQQGNGPPPGVCFVRSPPSYEASDTPVVKL